MSIQGLFRLLCCSPLQNSFDQGLQAWCDAKRGDREYQSRLQAAERIRGCKGFKADELGLSDLGLTSLPDEIWDLSLLTTLNLMGNRLQSLSPKINQLNRLRNISITENCLDSLPAELGELISLEFLDLANNRFRTFPNEILPLIHLTSLSLDGNTIEEIPKDIKYFRELKTLMLGRNRLTSIPEELFDLPSSCAIQLIRCRIPSENLAEMRSKINSPDYKGPAVTF